MISKKCTFWLRKTIGTDACVISACTLSFALYRTRNDPKFLDSRSVQTVLTQKEQSDQGLHCLASFAHITLWFSIFIQILGWLQQIFRVSKVLLFFTVLQWRESWLAMTTAAASV